MSVRVEKGTEAEAGAGRAAGVEGEAEMPGAGAERQADQFNVYVFYCFYCL